MWTVVVVDHHCCCCCCPSSHHLHTAVSCTVHTLDCSVRCDGSIRRWCRISIAYRAVFDSCSPISHSTVAVGAATAVVAVAGAECRWDSMTRGVSWCWSVGSWWCSGCCVSLRVFSFSGSALMSQFAAVEGFSFWCSQRNDICRWHWHRVQNGNSANFPQNLEVLGIDEQYPFTCLNDKNSPIWAQGTKWAGAFSSRGHFLSRTASSQLPNRQNVHTEKILLNTIDLQVDFNFVC